MTATREDLVFVEDGVEYMKLCFDVTIYWTGSMFDHAAGIQGFYQRALRAMPRPPTFHTTHEMTHAQPVGGIGLHVLPSWFARPDPTQDVFAFELESGPVPDLPSDSAIDFWASQVDGAGMIRAIFPVSMIAEGAPRLVELAKELVGDLAFHSGNGGYGLNWDSEGENEVVARREMGALSKRFPGIDLADPNITLMSIPRGMKRIGWLTFVGNELLARVGGAESLARELEGRGVGIEQLPGGMMLVAGPEPRVGDVNRQEPMDEYRAVGRALASVRSTDNVGFLADKDFDIIDELTEEWLAYFDR